MYCLNSQLTVVCVVRFFAVKSPVECKIFVRMFVYLLNAYLAA